MNIKKTKEKEKRLWLHTIFISQSELNEHTKKKTKEKEKRLWLHKIFISQSERAGQQFLINKILAEMSLDAVIE